MNAIRIGNKVRLRHEGIAITIPYDKYRELSPEQRRSLMLSTVSVYAHHVEMPRMCCKHCGCEDVSVRYWVDVNSNQPEPDVSEPVWCPSCERADYSMEDLKRVE